MKKMHVFTSRYLAKI